MQNADTTGISHDMYKWAAELFPICRSITGEGVRETLAYIKKLLPQLEIHEVPSGTKAFDWIVPDEWNIRDAYVADESGNRIVDFQKNNLHVLGYSEPVDAVLPLNELQKHLYSLPEQPDAIPYITSYYKRRWGFCLSDNQRKKLKSGQYKVKIDSTLDPGSLTYADLVVPGETNREILLSTYICCPSMANNELSGPCVVTALAQWISKLPSRKYTYRILFIPETIGSIVYLSRHYQEMKKNTVAGFVVTCVGDDRTYSYVESRKGNTLADRIAKHVLRHHYPAYKKYSFLARGSDERQFCSIGIDLPVCSITRSKYAEYLEYHTSDDDLDLISAEGLAGALEIYKQCIVLLENNNRYACNVLCEPQLGSRGLYPTISSRDSGAQVRTMMNLLAYADGDSDLLEIAEKINEYAGDLFPVAQKLLVAGVLSEKTLSGER